MTYEKFTLLLAVFGLLCILSKSDKAPADITMQLTYDSKSLENSNYEAKLRSVIRQEDSKTKIIVYEGDDQMKRQNHQSNQFELHISFFTENKTQPFSFTGTLTLESQYESRLTLEFKSSFTLDRKYLNYVNGKLRLSKTFYTSKLEELDVIITSQCQSNYYPENVCDTICVKTKNTKQCDRNGNKICEPGYYLNKERSTCDNDWCWPPPRCFNGGTCVNLPYRFQCRCTLSYKGTYCDEYEDACRDFVCPRETFCTIKNDKILCKAIEKLQKGFAKNKTEVLTISFMTMIVIAVAVAVFAIGLCVTFWACKRPKNRGYRLRSSEESMDFKSPSYYNYMDTKSNPHSVPVQTREHSYCACRNPEWANGQIDNYYSLQMPHDRGICRSIRPSSDLIMSRQTGRVSRASSIHTTTSNSGVDCDSLPPPPLLESEDAFAI